MNSLGKVTIDGFWGNRTVSLDFNKDVNFIIGDNGTGKTTIINIISSALKVEAVSLATLPFEKIELVLKPIRGRKKPRLTIVKRSNSRLGVFEIIYRIYESSKTKPEIYEFYVTNMLDEVRPTRIRVRSKNMDDFSELQNKLTRLFNVKWISVYRADDHGADREYWRRERPIREVDEKLLDFSRESIKMFSYLDSKIEDEKFKFQQKSFLTFITKAQDFDIGEMTEKEIEDLKSDLIALYEDNELNTQPNRAKVDRFFGNLKTGIGKIKKLKNKKNKEIKKNDFPNADENQAFWGTMNLTPTIQAWRELSDKKLEINAPKKRFFEKVNEMFNGKQVEVNSENELIAVKINKEGESVPFPLDDLSSGEKQLLIILGEAFLQNQKPCIYIADEPEISLHVRWQQQLVRNLKYVNPNAQIIFATHSPDIVSEFTKAIFDMGSIIK